MSLIPSQKTLWGKIEDMTCIMSEIPQYKNPSGEKNQRYDI